jgi:hypothetical protein
MRAGLGGQGDPEVRVAGERAEAGEADERLLHGDEGRVIDLIVVGRFPRFAEVFGDHERKGARRLDAFGEFAIDHHGGDAGDSVNG